MKYLSIIILLIFFFFISNCRLTACPSLADRYVSTVKPDHPVKYFLLSKMSERYIGEEREPIIDGWDGVKEDVVPYLKEEARSNYLLNYRDGVFYQGNEKLRCWILSCKFIYVVDQYGQIFIGPNKAKNNFHHSSFLAGQPVAAAGHITILRGKITYIDNVSGHYKPTVYHFNQILNELINRNLSFPHVIGVFAGIRVDEKKRREKIIRKINVPRIFYEQYQRDNQRRFSPELRSSGDFWLQKYLGLLDPFE